MQSDKKELLIEKPNNEIAVIATLIAVTLPVPSFRVNLSLCKLEIIVPIEIIIEIMPANEIGTLSSEYIVGHAEPRSESGKPRLIKDKYITANSS